jgi:hypothetical protein
MCPLRTGQDQLCGGRRSDGRRRQAHFDALVSHKLDAGTPMFSAAPIMPEQWGRTNLERLQQHAHLPWLGRSWAIPLALVA